MNTKQTPRQTYRLLRLTVKAFCLFANIWILGSCVPHAKAQEVWIRKGPFFYSNGRDDKPKNATVYDNSLSSTDASGKTNKITWSVPPPMLTEGQDVVLTLESTITTGAPLTGSWRVSDCGERDATVRDGDAASFAGLKRSGSFNLGKLVFRFKPGPFTPTMRVQAGRYDDYSGDMSVAVTWTYERGTPEKIGALPPNNIRVKIITTQSCTNAPNEATTALADVSVAIGGKQVTSNANGIAEVELPPGTYPVSASWGDAAFGFVSQQNRLAQKVTENGLPSVTLSGKGETLEVRMLTCDQKGQRKARAKVTEIGGRMRLKIRRADGSGALAQEASVGLVLRDGDEVRIEGRGKLEWLGGGTISFDNPGALSVIVIGPKRPEGAAAGPGVVESSFELIKGSLRFFFPSDGSDRENPEKKKNMFAPGTNSARFSIKGTIFTLSHNDQTQVSSIIVEQGSVEVTPTNAALRPFTLQAQQSAQVSLNNVTLGETVVAKGVGKGGVISGGDGNIGLINKPGAYAPIQQSAPASGGSGGGANPSDAGRRGSSGPPLCGLGVKWDVHDTIQPGLSDPGWQAVWIRRAGSNTFDGRWKRDGEPDVAAILTINVEGNKVTAHRQDYPSKWSVIDCVYEGTFAGAGEAALGRVTCKNSAGRLGPFNWEARITCDEGRGRIADNTREGGNKEGGNKDVDNRDDGNKDSGGGGNARPIDWNSYPADDYHKLRGKNGQRFTFSCPAIRNLERVRGTDIYTDDSRICLAAVHAGLITMDSGGNVTIEMLPGQGYYPGSVRYGVTSESYNDEVGYYSSYRFAGGGRLNNVIGLPQRAGPTRDGTSNSTSPTSASPTDVIGLPQKSQKQDKNIRLIVAVMERRTPKTLKTINADGIDTVAQIATLVGASVEETARLNGMSADTTPARGRHIKFYDEGKPVGGARVLVFHGTGKGVIKFSDYQGDTDGRGIVEIDVVKEGPVYIEVTKGDLRGSETVELTGPRTVEVEVEARDSISGIPIIYLKVHVVDQNGDPVSGARVAVGVYGDRQTYDGATGPDGDATVPVQFVANNYLIEVSKERYQTGQGKVTLNRTQYGKVVDGPTVKVKRAPGVEVTVNVMNADTKVPVDGAEVVLTGKFSISSPVYRGRTEGGQVKIFVAKYGSFDVEISQQYFETLKAKATFTDGEEQTTLPPFSLKEKPRKAEADMVYVTVLAGDKKAPIEGALVTVGKETAGTDASGQATIATALGDGTHVAVAATAKGYKSQTKTVPVRRGVRYTDASASATILLEPGEEEVSADMPIRLVVEIIDGLTNQPLGKTNVQLRFKGKVVGVEDTNAFGEARFELKDSASFPLSDLRTGLKVDAYHDNYIRRDSDITADLLLPSREPRSVTLHLERDWTELVKAIATLEGRVAAWNNDVLLVAEKAESVSKLVKQTSAAESRVNTLLGELNRSLGLTGGLDSLSNSTICRKAEESKRNILQYEVEALSKEQTLKQLLDEALTLAASCQDQVQANLIKSKHAAAIKLAAEIGGLEKQSIAQRKVLLSAARELEGRLIIEDVERLVAKIAELSREADQAAVTAEVDARRGAGLNRGLPGRRDALTAEIQALKATHGIDKFASGLPPNLKKLLDDMSALVGSRNNDAFAGPDPNAPGLVKAAADRIQAMRAEAESSLSSLKSASKQCEIQPMDDVFERIGNATVGATIELSAAASLPSKAVECAKRGACQPLIANVRPLLEKGDIKTAEAQINQARAQGCDVASLEEELDYFRTVREAANLLDLSKENCRFQEALNLAQQIPPSIKSRPLVTRALVAVERGLNAQKRIAQLIDSADKTNDIAAARSFIAEARRLASPYPCLKEIFGVVELTEEKLAAPKDSRPPPPPLGAELPERKPSIEELPEDADKPIARRTKKPTLEELPEDADKPIDKRSNKPKRKPVVEEIPDDADRPTATAGIKPKRKLIVEELPQDADKPIAKAGNVPRRKPAVEELPDAADRPAPRRSNTPGSQPPTAPSAGSLQLAETRVEKSIRGEFCGGGYGGYVEHIYSATSATRNIVCRPGEGGRVSIQWNFSGIPGSLSPGQEVTITIAGSFNTDLPDRDILPPPSAGVSTSGLEVVSQQNAYVSKSQKRDGKYVFRVPANAKSVTIQFGADNNLGYFAIYRYEKR